MMLRAIRTELVKYFTTRMWWGMALGVAAVAAAMTALMGWAVAAAGPPAEMMSDLDLARFVYTLGAGTGYLLLLIIGVMFVGQEYRHKTITSTFLSFPRRGLLMGAKVVAMIAVGAFYGLVYLVVSFITGASFLAASHHAVFPEPAKLLRTFALLLLIMGLWALIGLGLGIMIPNQIAAMAIAVGIVWIVEPILSIVLLVLDNKYAADVAKVLPSNASTAALESMSMMGGRSDHLPWWGGLLALVAWAAVSALIGSLLTVRKDIS